MKIRKKQVLALFLGAVLAAESAGLAELIREYPGRAYADMYRQASVSATTLNVRSAPGTGNSIVGKLTSGTAVTVVGEEKDSAGTVWYKIRYTSGSGTKEGYASAAYIRFPASYSQDSDFEAYLNQQGFPESYKSALRTLHAEHPTWVFQAQNTGLDWSEVIENEGAVGANLVDRNSISSWKSTEYGAYDWNTGKWTGFDGATWVAASKDLVCYYMDPRNFLDDTYVFQFLLHTYDSEHQTKEGLKSLLSGTFLEKENVTSGTGASSGSGSSGNSGTEAMGPGYSYQTETASPGPGGPGQTEVTTESTETKKAETGTQSGTESRPDIGFEGPSVSISARETEILAVPAVEYGPGMDASSITGDDTGASGTSPVPEGQSYADIIMKAAAQSGVNPYVLGAMIIQEQGKGTSGSISGKTAGYEGYYNFFNIGAYQAGSMSAVTRGLWYASQSGSYGRPWDSIEKSIVGGSVYYGDNYVKQGQDTFYLKKFNVQGSNLYKHQYMTNVEAAAGEGAKLARAYTDEMKKQTLVFKIPVYKNMPETACARPTGDGSPNNKLSGLEVTGYALTPTFSMNTESYDIIVNPAVEQIAVSAKAIDSRAKIAGVGIVNLNPGSNTVSVEVEAENGCVRIYKLNVVRQSDAPVVDPGSSNQFTGSQSGPGGEIGPGYTQPQMTAAPAETAASPVETTGPHTGSASAGQSSGESGSVSIGIGPGGQTAASTVSPGTAAVMPETTAAPETQAPVVETTAAAPETTAAAAALKKGDLNGDGSVTILDLMLIKRQILGENVLSGEQKAAADLDGDGSVTSKDAAELQKMIFGQ
ncbi:MAG: dockerin type I domain-containing protein [Lachnospiraceae bacterium]|nr:dockerin type I domain-containing protein [Lachnospiraceae bacterium]